MLHFGSSHVRCLDAIAVDASLACQRIKRESQLLLVIEGVSEFGRSYLLLLTVVLVRPGYRTYSRT